jgi:TPR repeat protein
MSKLIRCGVLALMLAPASVAAQNYDAGFYAYISGDFATALREFKPLAQQGDPRAQLRLAVMYHVGKGVPQDYAEAAEWFRRAAEQGVEDAQFILAGMYRNGEGVPQDDAEAAEWFRRAAEQGHARAQHNLAVMYFEGEGVLQNFVTAHVWFNLAAANGNEKATEARDRVASEMTSEAIVKAQKRAKICIESGYEDCE